MPGFDQQQQQRQLPQTSAAGSGQKASTSFSAFGQSSASSQAVFGQQQPFGPASPFNIGQSAAPSQAASGQQLQFGAAAPFSFGQSAAGVAQSGTAPFPAAQQPAPPVPAAAAQQPAPQSNFVFGAAPVNGQQPFGAQPAAGKHLAAHPCSLPGCRLP